MRAAVILPIMCVVPLIAAASPQNPSQIRIDAKVRQAKLTVGDRADLRVKFLTAPDVTIAPAFSATQFEPWELVEMTAPAPKPTKDGNIAHIFELKLVPWSVTVTATPALPFRVELPGRWTKTIAVSPQKIEMDSLLAKSEDTSDLRPLRGLIGYRSLFPLLAAVFLLAAAAVAWIFWRRRCRRIDARLPTPSRPPAELAREALERLLASDLLDKGEIKLFYTKLSEIPRRYIEDRFGIPALDRTTPELLPELRRRPEMREIYGDMRRFLESCDLVKFAKHAPGEDDIRRDVVCARRFVETTSLLESSSGERRG